MSESVFKHTVLILALLLWNSLANITTPPHWVSPPMTWLLLRLFFSHKGQSVYYHFKAKSKQSCSVVACTDSHTSLYRLPATEDITAKWIDFIYHGNIPPSVSKSVVVCTNHFTSDCFSNLGQYNAGLAIGLFLKDGYSDGREPVRPCLNASSDCILSAVKILLR